MKPVVGQFMLHEEEGQNGTGQTDGQTQHVDG